MAVDVVVGAVGPRGVSEHRDVGPRRAIDEQQERRADADEQARQRPEYRHPQQRGERREKVGRATHPNWRPSRLVYVS